MEQNNRSLKRIVVQIATPYSTGTGFYLKSAGMVITNDHIVRDNREVVVDGYGFDKQMVRVIFSDPAMDIALLEAPSNNELPAIPLLSPDKLKVDDLVWSVGHPFGLPYTTAAGKILDNDYQRGDVSYLRHDATLKPAYSGGPLVSASGDILGVNTFIVQEKGYLGLALPAAYLKQTIEASREAPGMVGQKCFSCGTNVFESNISKGRCPSCKQAVSLPSQAEEYQPAGVAQTIEALLSASGYEVNISRRGPNNWQIRQGSARINISYYEKTGLIIGDAFLCRLPPEKSEAIYEFLLRQNYDIDSLTFSVKGEDIVLSLLIYDRYLNLDTGMKLFAHLFEKADHYDDILVEQYGASWKKEEG